MDKDSGALAPIKQKGKVNIPKKHHRAGKRCCRSRDGLFVNKSALWRKTDAR
jgi:hypothetical protein